MHVCKTLLTWGILFTLCVAQTDLLISPWEKEVPETTLDMRMIEQSAQQAARTAIPCTVAIQAGMAHGSGVIISEDGYVLTAAHVIGQPGREVTVRLPDGRDFKAVTLGIHTTADAGLVKILNPQDLPFVPLVPENEAPGPGAWCLATGHPNGYLSERQAPVRLGRVIDVLPNVVRTECTITGGDSGGPLFDLAGRVIGVHSRIGEGLTENYHVPVAAFREAWSQLVAGETYPTRPRSEFLAMLDKDHDGKLTRAELEDEIERAVFDRLAENFELDTQEPVAIEEITTEKFNWRASPRLMLSRLTFPRETLEDSLPENEYMRGEKIQRLLRPTIADVAKSTVRVKSGRNSALGIVVDSGGYVITKASQLGEHPICQFSDDRKLEAKLVAKDFAYDIALLRVNANDLTPPDWNEEALPVGSWVFTPNAYGSVVATGVVSVPARSIERVPPVIGIRVDQRFEEPRVAEVTERSGAEKAGMKAGDLITHVNDVSVETFDKLVQALSRFQVGDRVGITVRREDETIMMEVTLGARGDVFLGIDDFRRMSGDLSKLRDGFPMAFQTDAIVPPDVCGGPVVDVAGKVAGLNIARSDRIASLCIPYHDLKVLIGKLKSEE